eukprot:4081100-Pyramimonas_sp.AAC.1
MHHHGHYRSARARALQRPHPAGKIRWRSRATPSISRVPLTMRPSNFWGALSTDGVGLSARPPLAAAEAR